MPIFCIICVENDFESDDDVLTAGLSIVFLQFTGAADSMIVVSIDKEYTETELNSNETVDILPNIYLPNQQYGYLPTSLLRSYPVQVGEFYFVKSQ